MGYLFVTYRSSPQEVPLNWVIWFDWQGDVDNGRLTVKFASSPQEVRLTNVVAFRVDPRR